MSIGEKQDKWLVIGLGNPEKKYDLTRHNIGFRILESLPLEFHEESQLQALIAKKENILFCKPLTYMNDSGIAAQRVSHYFHIELDHILVIYDDKEIPFGTLRVRSEGSDGGHNGIKSIIAHLGSSQFPRIRVGVGMTPEYMDAADFVLARFTHDEEKTVPHIIKAAHKTIQEILHNGVNKQSHRDISVDLEMNSQSEK